MSGKSLTIVSVQDAAPQWVAPNQVLFNDVLDNLDADYEVTYHKGGMSAEIILREAPTLPDCHRRQRDAVALVDRQVRARDRIAVRIVRRVPETLGDQFLEFFGDVVLEHLGLSVDPIPRHAEIG